MAALPITTEAMIAELPKKNAGGMPSGGGMGGFQGASVLRRCPWGQCRNGPRLIALNK